MGSADSPTQGNASPPEHTIHLAEDPPHYWITCGSTTVASITFGEPTHDRVRRWANRVVGAHKEAGCRAS